ncbi:MAG: Asp-tRNA(Asn)/Glu-tRNA(Gln) amidotransferase subunit GatB [Gammaproteobacteria bacterium]
MKWESVIGLEVHAQLATESKIFSSTPTRYGAEPNTQAGLIDLGYPGVLPVLNQKAVELAVTFGLAIDASIGRRSVFARKNYFYPDLPKGYQISQYDRPIVTGGGLDVLLSDGSVKRIGITRAHLEEDAGKSVHDLFPDSSGIDLNRAGTPLLEIVSEPDLRSAEEAVAYLKCLHTLVRYLEICDGNMQEGSFRCDANVSVRPIGQHDLSTRTEIKNLNSFRFVEQAIAFEIDRQIRVHEDGGIIVQETRLYDANRRETRPLRTKEDAHDYRYFPDPDLLPLVLEERFIEAIASRLPELPRAKRDRFMAVYGLSVYDATVLTQSRALAEYYETGMKGSALDSKIMANWVMGEVLAGLNRDHLEIEAVPVSATDLAGLLARIGDGTLSGKMAKEVFEAMWTGGGTADAVIDAKSLRQLSDTDTLEGVIDTVIAAHPEQWAEYCAGRDKLLGFFVGQVMQATRGQASPKLLNALLQKKRHPES